MRNLKTFIKDISTKPPLLFPLVALFHVLATLYIVWDVSDAPWPGMEWLNPLWMLAYTICWIAASDLRKWGGISYIILTVADLAILFATNSLNTGRADLYSSPLFPLDVIFCFFVLFYYKRFQ